MKIRPAKTYFINCSLRAYFMKNWLIKDLIKLAYINKIIFKVFLMNTCLDL